jgi:hypothetical protein
MGYPSLLIVWFGLLSVTDDVTWIVPIHAAGKTLFCRIGT